MIGKIIIAILVTFSIASKLPLPPLENSATECSRNRTYTDCGSACQPKCGDVDAHMPCILMCMPPGCYCGGDYAINEDDKCILKIDCPGNRPIAVTKSTPPPPVDCLRNENWDLEGSDCERNCKNRFYENLCIKIKREPACTCSFERGFVRGKHDECIRAEDCNKN
uniref:TIL domain-containing protein n=1 Tax=Rhabditophanes sp. KR3021 TaxID=114890 RepID=A0AC35U3M5_9BILA